jgi:hypothetical protein
MLALIDSIGIEDLFMITLGIAFLIFRLWITEVKLRKELGRRTKHLSRFLSYYLCLSLAFNFKSILFNSVVAGALPMMIISLFTLDYGFFFKAYKILRNDIGLNKARWALIERITLHIPLVSGGVYIYIKGFLEYVNLSFGMAPIIIGTLLVVIPVVFLDPRVTRKEDWPVGPIILFSVVVLSFIVWVQVL